MTRARTIRLVATFELLESLRSRKAIVLLLLYLCGAMWGSKKFIESIQSIQENLQEQFGGAVTMKMLMESPRVIKQLTAILGDGEVAAEIVTIPPLALFYGMTATYYFVPLLVLFTASDAISGDVSSGAVRYSLFRSDRLSWAVGKLIGQTSLMTVGVLLGGLGCWLAGVIWWGDMETGKTLLWMLRLSGTVIVYSFAYLCVAMCASQLVRTNARARALALLLMFLVWLGGVITNAPFTKDTAPDVFLVLSKFFPNGHSLALWHPGILERGGAMIGLVLIGLGYFALGFWRFAKRDA